MKPNEQTEFKNQFFLRRLKFAVNGLAAVFKRESSFKFQLIATEMLLIFCFLVRPSLLWCAIFSLCAAGVISLELINSAAEYFLDQYYPEPDENIGMIKDIMAAAVLIWSVVSIVVFVMFLFEKF